MMKYILSTAAILACSAASAQQQCAPREYVVDQLKNKYGETLQSVGMTAPDTFTEIWASSGGSWTFTVTLPDGTMCVVASGEQFQRIPQPNI